MMICVPVYTWVTSSLEVSSSFPSSHHIDTEHHLYQNQCTTQLPSTHKISVLNIQLKISKSYLYVMITFKYDTQNSTLTTLCFNGYFPRWTWVSQLPPLDYLYFSIFLNWAHNNIWCQPSVCLCMSECIRVSVDCERQQKLCVTLWQNTAAQCGNIPHMSAL